MKNVTGCITNIQRYSIHDGPGIRNTVFMKGCPLRCTWCANPETQSALPQLAYSAMKCIGCGRCAANCPQKALRLDETGKVLIDRGKCKVCFTCVHNCFAGAMHIFGETVTVDTVYQRLKTNRAWRMGGGVTVSGGEPLMQAEFVSELLKKCHTNGIHTAIETSGYAAWEDVEKVVSQCDLVFFDVKIADPALHQKYTGVNNARILENLRKISETFPQLQLVVRTPVIPEINSSPDSLRAIVDLLKTLPHLSDYELLPYHSFGAPKYAQLGKVYELEGLASGNKKEVEAWNKLFREELGLSEVAM